MGTEPCHNHNESVEESKVRVVNFVSQYLERYEHPVILNTIRRFVDRDEQNLKEILSLVDSIQHQNDMTHEDKRIIILDFIYNKLICMPNRSMNEREDISYQHNTSFKLSLETNNNNNKQANYQLCYCNIM